MLNPKPQVLQPRTALPANPSRQGSVGNLPSAKVSDASVAPSQNLLSEAGRLQQEYWKEFGNFLQRHGSFIQPSLSLPSAITTLVLNHPCFQPIPNMGSADKRISISLTISDTEAKQYLKSTPAEKARIENELGATICWTAGVGEQISRISLYYDKPVDPLDRRKWAAQHAWLCKKLEVIHQIFAPRQEASKVSANSKTNHQSAAPPLLADTGIPYNTQTCQPINLPSNNPASVNRILSAAEQLVTLKASARNAALVWRERITNKLDSIIVCLIALLLLAIPIVKHNFVTSVNIYNPPKNAISNMVLKSMTGEPFALGSLRGRVVLLNVWSTSCVPCRKEIPVLNMLQNDYEAKGLTVVGISWDDTPDDIKRFQKEKSAQNYTVLLQGKSLKENFGGLNGLPATYLIDQQGQIRQVLLGVNDRATLEPAIRSLTDTP